VKLKLTILRLFLVHFFGFFHLFFFHAFLRFSLGLFHHVFHFLAPLLLVDFFLGILAPAFLAVSSAIATACFFGYLPVDSSSEIFFPIAFLDFDLISGTLISYAV